jgi:SWI/SNF-related matrix-associated actin-dependent regulator 1 of chromatin subfamily A
MTRALYPFQEKAALFHLEKRYSLNCSEMGTGKSAMALEAAKRSGEKVLVIAPTFLKCTWLNEAAIAGVDIFFVPYSRIHLVKPADLIKYEFYIVDEIHYLQSPTTRRTHAFYALLKENLPKYFVGLTGTPIRNKIPNFWTLLGFCGTNPLATSGRVLEGNLRKYHAFCRHFCHVEQMFIGRGRKVDKYTSLRDNRVEEFKSYLKDKMIRFKVEDVLGDLPEMTRKNVFMSLNPSPELLEEFNSYMKGHKTNVEGKCKNALLKAPTTAEYCDNILSEGSGPLVIFSDHVESTLLIGKNLASKKYRVAVITGAISPSERARHVEEFQKGNLDAIVATIGSLSVGVTLTAARNLVLNDLSWVPADNLQAEKRIHRIGQKNACVAHYIHSSVTDEYIQKTLFEKLYSINKALN